MSAVSESKHEQPVSKLRLKKLVLSSSGNSILAVTQLLAQKRSIVGLITDSNRGLCGITSNKDITRRVVAKDVDPSCTSVAEVMTPNPSFVSMTVVKLKKTSLMKLKKTSLRKKFWQRNDCRLSNECLGIHIPRWKSRNR